MSEILPPPDPEEVTLFLAFMALVIYFTKDKYR